MLLRPEVVTKLQQELLEKSPQIRRVGDLWTQHGLQKDEYSGYLWRLLCNPGDKVLFLLIVLEAHYAADA